VGPSGRVVYMFCLRSSVKAMKLFFLLFLMLGINGFHVGLVSGVSASKFVYESQWPVVGPYFVDVDSSGNVYVAGRTSNRVEKFDSIGNSLTFWEGGPGTAEGKFNDPEGIAVDSIHGFIYVSDSKNNRIQKFDLNGQFKSNLGSFGAGDDKFNGPSGIDVDSAGNIYVADRENSRIKKLNANGEYLMQWGSYGTGNLGFHSPESVAVDSLGNVYVGDEENNRVQKFDSNGQFVSTLANYGSADGSVIDPEDVAVDGAGNVYVTDSDSRVQVFDKNGVFYAKFGTSGSGEGMLNDPRGITVDRFGNVYVADTGNERVQRFVVNNGLIKITVKDNNGNPLEGVLVKSISSPSGQDVISKTTDASGYLVFNEVLPGDYKFSASKAGYISSLTDTVSVTGNTVGEASIILEAESPYNSNLRLVVRDSSGNPIGGVSVYSYDQPVGQASLNKVTAANGIILFGPILPGEYVVQAAKPGYVSSTSSLSVVEKTTAEAEFVLRVQDPATCEIRVRIRDSNASPLEGAFVEMTMAPAGQEALTLTTGPGGVVVFEGVKPGVYKFKAGKTEYLDSTSDSVTVTAGGSADVLIDVIQESLATLLSVRVVDVFDSPIEGVDVETTNVPNGPWLMRGTTNSNGIVYGYPEVAGAYTLKASKTGYETKSVTTSVNVGGVTEVTIILEVAKGNLRVVVKDSSGAPVSLALVNLVTMPSGQAALSDLTDSNGVLSFTRVLIGDYVVQASKNGYAQVLSGTVIVTDGGTGAVNIVLSDDPTLGRIIITVKDQSDRVLTGVDVSSVVEPPGSSPLHGGTNTNGEAIFIGVAPGWWNFTASKSGYMPVEQSQRAKVILTAGATGRGTIILHAIVNDEGRAIIPGFPVESIIFGVVLCLAWYVLINRPRTRVRGF
jgi:streptogramin lyase